MEWISVNERLPELGVEVLVFRPSAHKTGDKNIQMDYMVKSERYDPDQVLHCWSRYWNATHWMPLPNFPNQKVTHQNRNNA